eukprot:TRINITY_DN8329_c0_g1_i2.p1 TRINITY_DN8329_c0_g1~~TRINITY_DN8329_c0_g1_i2.p1  ORF type:complete len:299 (-),score=69.01 TRINITY_DN8329_c0_g1_i2:577-1446(-)
MDGELVIPPESSTRYSLESLWLSRAPVGNLTQFENLKILYIHQSGDYRHLLEGCERIQSFLSPLTAPLDKHHYKKLVALDLSCVVIGVSEFLPVLENSTCLLCLAVGRIYSSWAKDFLLPSTVAKYVPGKFSGLLGLAMEEYTPITTTSYEEIVMSQPNLMHLSLSGMVDDETLLTFLKLKQLSLLQISRLFPIHGIKNSTWEKLWKHPSLSFSCWTSNLLDIPFKSHYNGFLLWEMRREVFRSWGLEIEPILILILLFLNQLQRKDRKLIMCLSPWRDLFQPDFLLSR